MKYKEYNADIAKQRSSRQGETVNCIDDVLFKFIDWLEYVYRIFFLKYTIHKIHKEIKYYSYKLSTRCEYFLKASDFYFNEQVKKSIKEILESEGYKVNVGNSFYKKEYYTDNDTYYTTIKISWEIQK